ncbi:MAG: ATP-binding protein [Armatimonadetes bacterium]|jgi:serine/threonine-protein kinase RsbW|nr:ATP-binding protein [Armatimonadota bacterium]
MFTLHMRQTPWRTPRIRVPEFNPYRPVRISIPSREQYLGEVRGLIERISIPTCLTGEDVAELKLAATEACLNAIRHGSPQGNSNLVDVQVKPELDRVVIEVRDEGRGFDVRKARQSPLPLGESGRGLKLIESLVDRAEYCNSRRGHLVRLTKRSRPATKVH